MDTPEGHYVELRTADVPIGWSNHPDLLLVEPYFTHRRVNETLHPSLHFSRPKPILTDNESLYIFEEEGRGYYVWNEISSDVAEIKENSLRDIIAQLKEGGMAYLTLSRLRRVGDPSGKPTSNIPYLPNPDLVDRPHLTENFQIPPPRSVLLYGLGGRGKSELAIQYASKVRTQLPETWVFWLCATTKKQFDEDLAAIPDILPEGPPTNQKMSRKDFALDWLRAQQGESWLVVVDDVRSDEVGVFSIIDELWRSNTKGSFIFTSSGDLQITEPPFTSSLLRLEVKLLEENEALQLLQRKLKRPLADADGHNLTTGINWTPLAVELAAASFNKGLISMAKFVQDIKLRQKKPLVEAYLSLSQSLNLYERNLLYFISFFQPPEVPSLWLSSYFEWRSDMKGFSELDDSLESLTESSLLVEISGTNAYKMQTEVRNLVVAELSANGNGEFNRWHNDTRSFIGSRNYIPNDRFLSDSRHVIETRPKKIKGRFGSLRNIRARLKRMTGLGGRNVWRSDTSTANMAPV